VGKTNLLVPSFASRVLLRCRNKTLLWRSQVSWFLRAKLVLLSSSGRPLWTSMIHAHAPSPDRWTWGEVRTSARNGMAAKFIVIVCLYRGSQAWAGLKEITKAVRLHFLRWPIQHFSALFSWTCNYLMGGIICKEICHFHSFGKLTFDFRSLILKNCGKVYRHKIYNFNSF